MISSAETDQIIPALVSALGKMDDITKTRTAEIPTKTGGKFSYQYADLSDVIGYVRPLLAGDGLAIIQEPFTDDKGSTAIATTIMHSSGQWIESRPLRLPTGNDAQSHGSAISFARRYQLLAQLGLATEDDDGATAKPAPPPKQPAKPRADAAPVMPSANATKKVMAMFAEAGIKGRGDRLAFTSWAVGRPVGSWSEVNAVESVNVIDALADLLGGKLEVVVEGDGLLKVRVAA